MLSHNMEDSDTPLDETVIFMGDVMSIYAFLHLLPEISRLADVR